MRLNSTFFILLFLSTSTIWAQSEKAKKMNVRADEYIIKMKSPTAGAQSFQQQKSTTEKAIRILSALGKDVEIKKTFSSSSMVHLKSKSKAKLDFLKNHPDVEFIEPNYILSTEPLDIKPFGVPPSVGDTYTQSYSAVQVNQAWSIAKPYNHSTPKTIVAVIDTGLDLSHGVFADSHSIWTNTAELNGLPGVDDDRNGYIDDIRGWNFVSRSGTMYDDGDHGTHVAGIVLGVGQDILAFPVRESRITIMPLKFLHGNGSGSTSDAIAAIDYAVYNGAKVINNSWGGSSYSRSLHEAYTNAYNRNVVIVSAAGNSSYNIDSTPMYPAALETPNNITVAATSDSDTRASFSNYSTNLVHVAAPGVGIISSVPGVCQAPGCYQMMSGTSMAAPFVAGLAALVIREAPQLSAYQVKGIITGQVDVVSVLSTRVQTSGRVNAFKSVQSAISNAATTAWAPTYVAAYKADSRSIASDAASPKAGCGLVKAVSAGAESGGPSGSDLILIFSVILLPVISAVALSRKKSVAAPSVAPVFQRKFERFKLAKDIVIKVGDQVVQSVSESMSVGGLSFANSAHFEKGQKIKVQIAGHAEDIEGEIVWCSQKNSFGVKFSEMTESLKTQMGFWTAGMSPT
jgi:thermitase